MKIIKTNGDITIEELKSFFGEELNPLFQQQRQVHLKFDLRTDADSLEVFNEELYDGFLFRIEKHGTEIHILKSEHYTDDVNALTLEDIINTLLMEFLGSRNIRYIGENS
ncbi:hypothetical protein MUY27_17870 [Mucilaginibacter sp. RS28]|uniref:Uncharacterized protein n=1 Tax=Mucilaginibacter straminoryzae TaxID=2932774 RepID=A0A9X2BAN2_9SPHI|nr:hypothetical protein [Mucilaginibacter straminoryzae]MCJ8211591.1 hypothetical protein [Mucilaginibacter straminoryzae]